MDWENDGYIISSYKAWLTPCIPKYAFIHQNISNLNLWQLVSFRGWWIFIPLLSKLLPWNKLKYLFNHYIIVITVCTTIVYLCNKTNYFLESTFSNRDNVRAPIQFRREIQPKHLKRLLFLKTRPIHFHINITSVIIDWSNKTSWLFPALKSTSHFLPQSTVSCRSNSNSGANSSSCYRSNAWLYLEWRVVSSA